MPTEDGVTEVTGDGWGMPDMTYKGWAIVELMGHRRLEGRVEGVRLFGEPMILIEVPDAPIDEGGFRRVYVSPKSLYAFTPTTMARILGARSMLSAPPARPDDPGVDDEGPDLDDDDEPEDEPGALPAIEQPAPLEEIHGSLASEGGLDAPLEPPRADAPEQRKVPDDVDIPF